MPWVYHQHQTGRESRLHQQCHGYHGIFTQSYHGFGALALSLALVRGFHLISRVVTALLTSICRVIIEL
jgi:hypothetical protein